MWFWVMNVSFTEKRGIRIGSREHNEVKRPDIFPSKPNIAFELVATLCSVPVAVISERHFLRSIDRSITTQYQPNSLENLL